MTVRILYNPASAQRQEALKSTVHETVSDLHLLYKLTPGAELLQDGVLHKINRWGFRDREFPLEKTPGKKRVLFLGDSVVYGYALPVEASLPKQLENKLIEKGVDAEVLNFGVLGYETAQHLEFFKLVGRQFKPDLVLLGHTFNDVRFASFELNKFNEQDRWRVPSLQIHWHERIPQLIYKNFRLFQYLDKEKGLFNHWKTKKIYALRGEKSIWHYVRDLNEVHQDKPDSPYRKLRTEIESEAARLGTPPGNLSEMLELAGYSENVMYSSHWNVSKKAAQELKQISVQDGFDLWAILFPYLSSLDRYPLKPLHLFLKNEYEQMDIPVFDGLGALQSAAANSKEALTMDSVHFTAEGFSYLAEVLAEEIKKAL